MLLLGTGHCFRDHVLEVCPEFARFSSDAEASARASRALPLETIKHMVSGPPAWAMTLVPRLSVPRDALAPVSRRRKDEDPSSVTSPSPTSGGAPPTMRRVVLAWRRSFTRYEAIAAAQRRLRLRAAGREAPVLIAPAIPSRKLP